MWICGGSTCLRAAMLHVMPPACTLRATAAPARKLNHPLLQAAHATAASIFFLETLEPRVNQRKK